MREQQPIDDLFARALRDATSEPPPAAWDGIISKRDREHVALLRIQRRWWIIPLLLLFAGGAAGYMTSADGAHSGPETVARGDLNGGHIRTGNAELLDPTPVDLLVQRSNVPDENSKTVPASRQSKVQGSPVQPSENAHSPMVKLQVSPVVANDIRDMMGPVAMEGSSPDRSVQRVTAASNSAPTGMRDPGQPPMEETRDDRLLTGKVTYRSAMAPEFSDVVPEWMDARGTLPERSVLLGTLMGRVGSDVVMSKGYWWVAAEVGRSIETRTWQDDDTELMDELNATETTHRPLHIGAMGGFTRTDGWGFFSGMSFTVGHYDFRHVDRIMRSTDSISSYIITFNNEVIADYSDTLTLITEEDHAVSSVNQYASVVVPLNVSWHRPFRRWKLGARAGVAVEVNTLRSGVMLSTRQNDGSLRSVDASEMERRTSALISGVIAADVGYVLKERIVLWLSPSYAHGLFPLVTTTGNLYAIPERMDMSLRLSYTLGPR